MFVDRKHNSVKTLQHKYRQIYFGNTSEVKDLVTSLRNDVCKHKETENRIISENFYYFSVKKYLYSVYSPNNKYCTPLCFMGVKFDLHTKRSTKSEGIREEHGSENGIWI